MVSDAYYFADPLEVPDVTVWMQLKSRREEDLDP